MKKQLLFACVAIGTCTYSTYAQENNSIQEVGNIGIGTTTPQSKLDVRGNVKIDSTLTVKDDVTIEKNLRVMETATFLGQTDMNKVGISGRFNANGDSRFYGTLRLPALTNTTNLTNTSFVITNAEGLASKVSPDTVANMLKAHIYSEPFDVDFYCTQVAPVAPTWSNGAYKIYSNCPSVNVGIGTPNPRVNLDVRGSAYMNRIAINSDPLTMGSKLFHLKANLTHPSQNGDVLFLVENHERALFQISNNGIARSREVIVNLEQAWPDYVFDSDYKLAPLQEVASFIEENGHLPNVPNAAQVASEGIQLGEMNRILLEKVEELTLHLIEQQKQIEEQKQRIEALETTNK